jgi:serine/threonine-protein kinase
VISPVPGDRPLIGKSLTHYEIRETLGVGGMGEVYLARDSKLNRDVALKLLPETFAGDAERIARFQREARTLASLNHPNIAAIYGVDEAEEHRFLVMELVEGEDLAERLKRGAIPVEEALDLARQIADGLEEAHEQGVMHRDLKPANVMITPGGKVKILDFGLARAFQGEAVDESDFSTSPTITGALTQAHVILGTAGYMSPEQAKGKPVDRRTDLWAFGVLLWEMLTGKRLFEGEDIGDTLAAVLRAEIPWEDLPAAVPAPVRRLLERCLERDPRKRLRDIGEARVRLERWTSDPSSLDIIAVPTVAAAGKRAWLPWAVAAVGVVAALWGWARQSQDSVSPRRSLHLEIRLAHEESMPIDGGVGLQVSPDGTTLGYLTPEGIRVRRFDARGERLLEDTDGARQFAFSPDSRWIAFVGRGMLRRVSVNGGTSIDLCDIGTARGLTWVNDATLVVAPDVITGLHRVSLSDGRMEELTAVDAEAGERSHRWPTRMPDGESVVFQCQYLSEQYDASEIRIVSLAGGDQRAVYRGGSSPRYVSTGHLLFVRDGTLFATPLDLGEAVPARLPVPVLSSIWARVDSEDAHDGTAQFDVSPDGTLAYRTGHSAKIHVARIDFSTGSRERITEPGDLGRLALSPDGRRLVMSGVAGSESSLFLVDLATGTQSRLTFERDTTDRLACWSPDSKTLYWTRGVKNQHVVLRRPADGSGPEEELYRSNIPLGVTGVAPDERLLLLNVMSEGDAFDVMSLSLTDPEARPELLAGGPGNQLWAQFSPDGRWISYGSSALGLTAELNIQRYPDEGSRWQILKGAALRGVTWAPDQSAILVADLNAIIRIPLALGEGTLSAGRPDTLAIDDSVRGQGGWSAAVAPDGTHAYVLRPEPSTEDTQSHVVVVTNWLDELRRLVPTE